MVALLFAVCLLFIVALVALALGVIGVVMGVVTALALLNVSAVILGVLVQQRRRAETWTSGIPPAAAEAQREPIVPDGESIRIARVPHLDQFPD
jgi:hypothetical protein